jgi:hypothetical protein
VCAYISNIKEFPEAVFFPGASEKYRSKHEILIQKLIATGTRPTPERIEILVEFSDQNFSRKLLDECFSVSECVSLPEISERADFDVTYPRLTDSEILSILDKNPANQRWLQDFFLRLAKRYSIPLKKDLIAAANQLLRFLCTEVSYWEADSFPLDAMIELSNRYDWTFRTDSWSLREQLRREANVIYKGWVDLFKLAENTPLFVILNQRAPTDYFHSFLPKGVSQYRKDSLQTEMKILLYPDLKISSSEHRVLLEHTIEGKGLETAVQIASQLGRIPVLCDFSRRRFSRALMRATRFAAYKNWGIQPLGKMFDPVTTGIPKAKSPHGFSSTPGNPRLVLFDPWPISDTQIIRQLGSEMEKFCNQEPRTKPWQDDRVGARYELEINTRGRYEIDSESWVVPVLGGWMRVDQVFKSRLARFLSMKEYDNCT